MATLPTFEKILLEVHQSLGLGSIQTTTKNKFADLGYSFETQKKKTEELVIAIFSALGMDAAACRDALANLFEWASFHKALELHTWTSKADERQVVWHMLGYSYAPALGRRIASWNLEGAFDKGMPGGAFWFLPATDNKTGALSLPVPQVVDWLLDLLARPMDQAHTEFGGARTERAGNHDSIERNLYNWRSGNIPGPSKIAEYFPDDAKIDFKGTFDTTEGQSQDAQFDAAVEFVRNTKGLSPDDLRTQIPMTQPGRIEAIFDGSATVDERLTFVELVRTRYATPSMRTIRHRLLVARMVQDGYRRLLKFLCPGVDPFSTDPRSNKLLQVAAIFQMSYNLTVEAWKNCDTEAAENAWFESKLGWWDRAETFLSVLPSRREFASQDLGALLSRRFAMLVDDAPLDDLVGLTPESAVEIIERRIIRLKSEAADDQRYLDLVDRIRRSSPWRALQEEADYWVVSQVAQCENISPHARQLAVERLAELSIRPEQVLGRIMIELGTHLNESPSRRQKDTQQRVEALLTEARSLLPGAHWNAPLLQYEAKHLLAKNDFDGALVLFREALEACSGWNYATLRGEIARDAFAIEVANQKLIPGNHEKYYRNMLAYEMLANDKFGLEDTAVWVADYFWSDLYKPYPGIERLKPLSAREASNLIDEPIPLILEANWDGLRAWMRRNAKFLQKSTLREARANTVLMAWIKMKHHFGRIERLAGHTNLSNHQSGRVASHVRLENWYQAIALLAESWPAQLNIADFKGQTPLMLVADAGDEALTVAFTAAGANVDAQDYKGRTPLHAAITGGSEPCVAAVLASHPDLRKTTTSDSQTVLHTAVRMGKPNIVRMLVESDPGLKYLKNASGQTPSALVEAILANFDKHQAEMTANHRRTGTRLAFDEIGSMLKDHEKLH